MEKAICKDHKKKGRTPEGATLKLYHNLSGLPEKPAQNISPGAP